MEILDLPPKLKYNNGNNIPPNLIVIAYITLLFSLLFLFTIGFLLAGIILMSLSLMVITNRNIVNIDIEKQIIHDYSLFFGFLKSGKKFQLYCYKYITVIPQIESSQIYGRSSNSTIISNSYATVTLLGENLKGKKSITKFVSKEKATDIAKSLASRLEIKYFEYDPKLVRKVLLGQTTI